MKTNCQYCKEEVDRHSVIRPATCFDCKIKMRKQYYLDNKKRIDKQSKIYRERNREKINKRYRETYEMKKHIKASEG